MNRIPHVFPALLFFAVIVGQPVFGDVQRTSNPSDRGLTEADFPRIQSIADGVYTYEALTGPADDRYTTNTMFIVGDNGVLVADGQGSPEETAALVDAIGKITKTPITHVVICSDHGDHTNGNSEFPDDAEFIAHRNSLPALQRAGEAGGRMPDVVIDDRLDLMIGNRDVEVLFLGRAHTGGDLFVHLPDDGILFTTEVFLNHMFSGFRSAYTREWIDVLARAEALDPDVYIPGHGFVDDRQVLDEEWTAHRKHVTYVFETVAVMHEAGLTVDEAIEKADWGPYSDWSGAEFQGRIAIERIYAELNNELE